MRSLVPATLVVVALVAVTARSQPSDGLEVQGLRGTIPRQAAQQVIAARMSDFVDCVTDRRARNELVGGSAKVDFVIAVNGTVRVARLEASDLGDRDAERCILRIAASLRFPVPTGGEANVEDTLQFPLDADVRPALSWRADRVTGTAASALARIPSRCRMTGGSVRVTAFVGRGGEFLDAGGFASALEVDPRIDCVLDAVSDLDFPDPGSYPAKVSFDVGAR